MAQLTIRNLDDRVYQRLRDHAKLNHRSLEAEVRTILERAVTPDRADVIRQAAEMRERLKGRYVGDSTADIREDRDRLEGRGR